ncbi:Tat pathway signal sequence domain protein [Caulobacter sp. CCUG 60055]|uniref:Tat pathway signal sequence domain protein n=1 Tax=Caulobacter sp. CCUG 60055 TaxID=2100090 RepID=UPI001FA6D0E4|nr:Tat pathway signal sequence domain protein [Caulobacter sp. CCUG 60055]MBQ1541881.1 Tat pathway signal sequence domain protein [Caulobacteraceae bacterium]MCI3181264.1 Tat pathway signal sequence domain protein [Caulobacter sp. CCUG 60055]
MRRSFLLVSAVIAALVASAPAAYAQSRGGRGQGGQDQGADDAKKKKRDQEWGNGQAPLKQLRNAGPCPYVKVLYDAGRYVEFKDNKTASAQAGYTGEIQKLGSGCEYKSDEPIKLALEVLFEFGRGPQAEGSAHAYRYWVAVTDRNRSVLAKQYFDVKADFPAGQDRVYVTDTINEIVIPRAKATISGNNFEVLVGFDVTPEMAQFNREGKRFRVNASGTQQAAAKP